jgi:non-specific serine/threonine protein kinase
VGEGTAIAHLARCHIARGHPAQAVPLLDEAMPLLRTFAEPADLAVGLLYFGLCAIFTGQPALACERLAEGVEMCHQIGFESLGARARLLLGYARIDLGDLDGARAALSEALPTSMRFGDHWVIAQQMGGFAGIAARRGQPRQALRFAGFARAFSQRHDFSVPYVARERVDYWTGPARQALGAAAEAAFAEGQQMTLDEAAAVALATEPEGARQPVTGPMLTARELEVAGLVARGCTNREIADRLCLSVRTVEVHVDHILTKLGFNTRTQLARWAYDTNVVPKTT